jgi:hypothetical protein
VEGGAEGDWKDQGGTGAGAEQPGEASRGPRAGGWRKRPWPGVLAVLAALGLLAVGFVAGDIVGHSGAPGPATAAASPSVTAAAGSAAATEPVIAPSASSSPTSQTPTPGPTSTASPAALVFQALGTADCPFGGANNPSCTTTVVAYFSDPSARGAAQETATVAFATPGVRIGTETSIGTETLVEATQTSGLYSVIVGEVWFPATGTYPYTVTVTDTADGRTGSWSGTVQVSALPAAS